MIWGIPYWRFDIEKRPKRSYARPLPHAVIFLQNCFRLPKRCSYHLCAREGRCLQLALLECSIVCGRTQRVYHKHKTPAPNPKP